MLTQLSSRLSHSSGGSQELSHMELTLRVEACSAVSFVATEAPEYRVFVLWNSLVLRKTARGDLCG